MSSDAASALATLSAQASEHPTGPAGRRTAWHRLGSGPPVVLLHGGHGSWLHWVRNVAALAATHTVWAPDMPGYGESDAPAPLGLEGLLGQLQAGLDELIGPGAACALVGFSFGGLVAAHLAARRPAVSALALLGPAGHGTARRAAAELIGWRGLPQLADDPALQAVMRHNLCAHMLHRPDAVDAVALRLHTEACLRTRFRSKPISRGNGLKACVEAYPGPLLLLWGEHDVTTTPAQAQALLAEGRRVPPRSVVLPGVGHWVQYEAADAVNAELLRCLAEHPVA